MSSFVMSDQYPEFVSEIQKIGHKVIASDTIDIFHKPEQRHADMQVLPIKNNVFILQECNILKCKLEKYNPIICRKSAEKSYPENVILNFLYFKNCLFGKIDAIDSSVKEYCVNNNIKIVNVNQGYCRCSTLVVSDNAVITADKSIEFAIKSEGADVLRISEGHIRLEGFDYGFIGGASAEIDDTIYFFGNIENHPDYNIIKKFIYKHNKKIKILCQEMPLTDIGGLVKME